MSEGRSSSEVLMTATTGSLDPVSPIAYVHGLLGRTVRILLTDGVRVFQGIFSALDYRGMVAFRDVSELTEGHEGQVGACIISLYNIQKMELID
jgi:small nuclear ribonucleoprotein (snRNP)-like protein